MVDHIEFTEDTDIEIDTSVTDDTRVNKVHLEDLSFILDLEYEGDEVSYCKIDFDVLVHVMTLYSAMEQQEYDWRPY
jgi:hypothetical protein